MELAAVFQGELPGAAEAGESPSELEAHLRAMVARGRAAHPGLALDDGAFVRHLAGAVARAGDSGSSGLARLAIEDLYLACACALGVAGAAERFEERCGARLRVVVTTMARLPDLRAEVQQRVRDALLVGGVDRPPRIVSYGGQGPLDSWAAVIAHREVVAILRTEAVEQRAREGAAVEAAMVTAPEPELVYVKQRYGADFERAMTDALSVLSERDRLMLRLHLVSRLSLESIGKMYGVSQATASRWVARAREAVSEEVTRLLRERLRVSPSEIASLAGLVASQIDVSMSRLLGPSGLTG